MHCNFTKGYNRFNANGEYYKILEETINKTICEKALGIY